MRVTYKCPWKSILSVADIFLQRVKWKIGSGEIVRFWEDCWSKGEPLCSRFHALSRISSLKEQPIVRFISEDNS